MSQPNLRKIPALEKIDVRAGVVLRPLVITDAALLLGILDTDPVIRERVGVAARLHTVKDVKTLLEEEQNDSAIIRYIVSENEMVVGMVNFWRAGDYFGDRANPNDYGFGYFLAPWARGRGLVTDSLIALMATASENLPVKTFIAFCEADNEASGGVLRKAGFEKTDVAWKDDVHGWLEQKYLRDISGTP